MMLKTWYVSSNSWVNDHLTCGGNLMVSLNICHYNHHTLVLKVIKPYIVNTTFEWALRVWKFHSSFHLILLLNNRLFHPIILYIKAIVVCLWRMFWGVGEGRARWSMGRGDGPARARGGGARAGKDQQVHYAPGSH
jgi:hypothetical protein